MKKITIKFTDRDLKMIKRLNLILGIPIVLLLVWIVVQAINKP